MGKPTTSEAESNEVAKKMATVTTASHRHSKTWQAGQAVLVQEWLYDFSSNQFRQVVTLRNGQVVDIESRPGR